MQRICIIDGHPDPAPGRFVHALADAYEQGAKQGGHETYRVRVADMDIPFLRLKSEYERGDPPAALRPVLDALEWASHLAIFYPLWLGAAPALLKAFLEQTIRPGFAFSTATLGHWPVRYLAGRSSRIVVTMGMSRFAYDWYLGAAGTRSLERGVLGISGVRPVRTTIISRAERMAAPVRAYWLRKMSALGQRAR